MSEYLEKYLKYKNKYLKLKNISGGGKFGSNKTSFSKPSKHNSHSSKEKSEEDKYNMDLEQRQSKYDSDIKQDLKPLDEYYKKLLDYYDFKLNQAKITKGFNEFKKKYDDEQTNKKEYEKCIKKNWLTGYGCKNVNPSFNYSYTFKQFLLYMNKDQDKRYFINYVNDDGTLQTFDEIKSKIGDPPTIPTNLTKKEVSNDVEILTFENEIKDYDEFKKNDIISDEDYKKVANFINTILGQYKIVSATQDN
jgi:hypothetical protein